MIKNGVAAYQIKDLEKDVDSLKKDMRSVLENHLPHLHEEISNLRTRINVLSIINVGAIILGILMVRFLK